MSTTLAPPREPSGAPAEVGSRRLTERVFRVRESGIIAVLALFVLITAVIQPRFVSSSNIQFILVDTAVYALVALGETMVIISRNVDLSVQSVLALSAYLSASLFGHVHGIPIPVVFLVGLGIGLAFGAANGLMVSLGRVPSLVVTLATLYIIQGIDILVVGGNEVVASSLPSGFVAIPNVTIFGIPWLAIAVAAVIGAGAYYLRSFRSGRELYAIGSNPEGGPAGRHPGGQAGVHRVHRCAAGSPGSAACCGPPSTRRSTPARAGTNFSLIVIAAVVVGGVAIFGGSGSAVGAASGRCCSGPSTWPWTCSASPTSGIRRSPGSCCCWPSRWTALISVRLAAALRRRSARDGT